MAQELIYTSAPAGIDRNSSGFCVVACTDGINVRIKTTLEGLSAYKPLYPHYAPNAWDNPVSRSHYICRSGNTLYHVLSRICFNGVDHTGRSNKLASHIVLSPEECTAAAGGPASVLLNEKLFKDAGWKIQAEKYEKELTIPPSQESTSDFSGWKCIMHDPGWAGYLAQSFLANPKSVVYISYPPEMHDKLTGLVDEALCMLPAAARWEVSFNTYFVTLPAGVSCNWRFCPEGSDAIISARRSPVNTVIDLATPSAAPGDSGLVKLARDGVSDIRQIREHALPYLKQIIRDTALEDISEQPIPNVPAENRIGEKKFRPIVMSGQKQKTEKAAHKSIISGVPKKFLKSAIFTLSGVLLLIIAILVICSVREAREKSHAQQIQKEISELKSTFRQLEKESNELKIGIREGLGDCSGKTELLENLLKKRVQLAEEMQRLAKYNSVIEAHSEDLIPELPSDLAEHFKTSNTHLKRDIDDFRRNAVRPARKSPEVVAVPVAVPAPVDKKPRTKKTPAAKRTPAAKVKADIPEFAWQNMRKNPLVFKGNSVSVAVGSVPAKSIKITLITSGGSSQTVSPGEKVYAIDPGTGNESVLKTEFVRGSVKITLENQHSVSERTLLKISAGNKVYPLFFVPGFSKLKKINAAKQLRFDIRHNRVTAELDLKKSVPLYCYTMDGRRLEHYPLLVLDGGANGYCRLAYKGAGKFSGTFTSDFVDSMFNEKQLLETLRQKISSNFENLTERDLNTVASLYSKKQKKEILANAAKWKDTVSEETVTKMAAAAKQKIDPLSSPLKNAEKLSRINVENSNPAFEKWVSQYKSLKEKRGEYLEDLQKQILERKKRIKRETAKFKAGKITLKLVDPSTNKNYPQWKNGEANEI